MFIESFFIRGHIDSFVHPLRQLCSAETSEQALIYLKARQHEGLAHLVPPTSRSKDIHVRFRTISFPHLTSQTVERWLVRRNEIGQVIGGFQLALDHTGIWLLGEWIRREGRRAQEQKFALPLWEVVEALPEAMSTLRQALRWMAESWRAEADLLSGGGVRQQEIAKGLRGRLALPLKMGLAQRIFEDELGWFLYEAELELLLPQLSEVIMVPLREWLNDLRLDQPTQPIILIPHQRLRRFPLHDALVLDAHTGQKIPFQETCKLAYKEIRPSS